jgi:hypothetical protein
VKRTLRIGPSTKCRFESDGVAPVVLAPGAELDLLSPMDLFCESVF